MEKVQRGNNETWPKSNTKRVQYEKIVTWKKYNVKQMWHEKSDKNEIWEEYVQE